MLNKFVPLISQTLIAENDRLKEEVIHLSKQLKKYENKIIQTLTNIRSNFQFIFQNPYQLLNIFVEELQTHQSKNRQIKLENQTLLKQKQRLISRVSELESSILDSKRNEEFIIQQLNTKIQQKKRKLDQLQENLHDVLQAKKIAQMELKEIRDQMKILRLKLYEEQRQKVTQIIVANKKQMLEFKKNLEIQSYKLEMQYKKGIQKRDKQIKTLFKNIQQISNNKLSSSSNLSVLQKIIKPMKDHSQLNMVISEMKNQLSDQKQQLRDKVLKTLQLQGKCADLKMQNDNLKSNIQRLEIQKQSVIQKLKLTNQTLDKSQHDKKAMQAYYDQRWQSQFSKVRVNLEEKYLQKTQKLQQQYEKKKKQVQSTIRGYIEQIRIKKTQIKTLEDQKLILFQQNQILKQKIAKLSQQNVQLKSKNTQNGLMHAQDIIATKEKYQTKIDAILTNIGRLEKIIQNLNKQLQSVKQNHKEVIRKNNKDHFAQVQKIKTECQQTRQAQQRAYERQIKQLNTMYSDVQATMEKIRIQEREKFLEKQKQIISRYNQGKKQYQESYQKKLARLTQKIVENDFKFQKIRKKKQQQIDLLMQQKIDLQAMLHQRKTQLVSRDVQIQQYSKMKGEYMKQLKKLQIQTETAQFQLESSQTMLNSKLLQIQGLKDEIQNFKIQRVKFNQQIAIFQKQMKNEFNNLKKVSQRQVMFYKSKIWELEKITAQRPMSSKDLSEILSLKDKNQDLMDQIQIKQAQNVVLIQIKDYYQNKFKLQNQVNVFVNTSASKDPAECIYVKRPNRKNMLLHGTGSKLPKKRMHTSIHMYSFQDEIKPQLRQVTEIKKYINKNRHDSRSQSRKLRISSSLL